MGVVNSGNLLSQDSQEEMEASSQAWASPLSSSDGQSHYPVFDALITLVPDPGESRFQLPQTHEVH